MPLRAAQVSEWDPVGRLGVYETWYGLGVVPGTAGGRRVALAHEQTVAMMSIEAYQQRLDHLFGVTLDERRWLADQRTLPPRLRDVQRARACAKAFLVAGVFTVIIVTFVVGSGMLVSQGKLSIELAALYVSPIVLICLLLLGMVAYRGIADRRALDAGVIDLRQGALQKRRLHSRGSPPSYVVFVDDADYFKVSSNVYDALNEGQPHRLHVIRGTRFVLAIEPSV